MSKPSQVARDLLAEANSLRSGQRLLIDQMVALSDRLVDAVAPDEAMIIREELDVLSTRFDQLAHRVRELDDKLRKRLELEIRNERGDSDPDDPNQG